MSKRGWHGYDLDGTLAKYISKQGVKTIGEPIPATVARARKQLEDGEEVRIVTARVSPEWDDQEFQTSLIKEWCGLHIGWELPVQCHKDGSMLTLTDDRAIGVVVNTGETHAEQAERQTVEAILQYAEQRDLDPSDTNSLAILLEAIENRLWK